MKYKLNKRLNDKTSNHNDRWHSKMRQLIYQLNCQQLKKNDGTMIRKEINIEKEKCSKSLNGNGI